MGGTGFSEDNLRGTHTVFPFTKHPQQYALFLPITHVVLMQTFSLLVTHIILVHTQPISRAQHHARGTEQGT